eukprot:CAMPEP_0174271636 /NCGR_PEP_ID=MMETSP0439-20130205/48535_1 /TAXON_ID=0 /ORGANISM="Stereomyxa ramosa, Strain Chinc5" /LENGTH=201 /DNA_ID=CAMNT_0015361761 /DNA_START=374 /DNA_END=979 /DNA_ORIENTATION=+
MHRKQFSEPNPSASYGEVTLMMRNRWCTLLPEDKQIYEIMAKEEYRKYLEKVEEYNKTKEHQKIQPVAEPRDSTVFYDEIDINWKVGEILQSKFDMYSSYVTNCSLEQNYSMMSTDCYFVQAKQAALDWKEDQIYDPLSSGEEPEYFEKMEKEDSDKENKSEKLNEIYERIYPVRNHPVNILSPKQLQALQTQYVVELPKK